MSLIVSLLVVIAVAGLLIIALLSRKTGVFKAPVRTLIVLGSGGHTAEMFKLLETLDIGGNYKPVAFLVAENDTLSRSKLVQSRDLASKGCSIIPIKRSRNVGQSYITSVFTTLAAGVDSFFVYLRYKPDIIICNGPGTCIPMCLIAKLYPFKKSAVIFVESFCRTKSFSMSGKILYYVADQFLVQWPYLSQKYKRAKYIGRLV